MDESLTPLEFEQAVQELLEDTGRGLDNFSTSHREVIRSPDGLYEIDVVVRFQAAGADFLVLVECKRHESSIKREVVQVLADKIRATGAQKGVMFSTSRFQSGAIQYAAQHGIALVRLVGDAEAEWVLRRSRGESASPRTSSHFAFWFVSPEPADPHHGTSQQLAHYLADGQSARGR